MALKAQVQEDMKAAMKAGADGRLRLSTLRLLLSEIKNAEIAKGEELADEDIVSLLQREIKRRNEAAEQYQKGGRADLTDKERAEAEILEGYLPQQLSDDELKGIVSQVIADVGAEGPGQTGAVMGTVMPRVKGKADGKRVSSIVQELLSG